LIDVEAPVGHGPGEQPAPERLRQTRGRVPPRDEDAGLDAAGAVPLHSEAVGDVLGGDADGEWAGPQRGQPDQADPGDGQPAVPGRPERRREAAGRHIGVDAVAHEHPAIDGADDSRWTDKALLRVWRTITILVNTHRVIGVNRDKLEAVDELTVEDLARD